MSPTMKNQKAIKGRLEAGVTLGSSVPEAGNNGNWVGVSVSHVGCREALKREEINKLYISILDVMEKSLNINTLGVNRVDCSMESQFLIGDSVAQ